MERRKRHDLEINWSMESLRWGLACLQEDLLEGIHLDPVRSS